jgi:hypothetical protein
MLIERGREAPESRVVSLGRKDNAQAKTGPRRADASLGGVQLFFACSSSADHICPNAASKSRRNVGEEQVVEYARGGSKERQSNCDGQPSAV